MRGMMAIISVTNDVAQQKNNSQVDFLNFNIDNVENYSYGNILQILSWWSRPSFFYVTNVMRSQNTEQIKIPSTLHSWPCQYKDYRLMGTEYKCVAMLKYILNDD